MDATRRPDLPFFSKRVLQGDYYVLDLDPPGTADLTVVCGGRELCAADYGIDRDDFRYLSVEYVDAGSGRVTLAGRSYPLVPGSLFRYGPGLPHRISADDGAPMVKYFVDFSGLSAAKLLSAGPWSDLRPLRVADPSRMRALFDELGRRAQRPTAHTARLCTLLLEQILLLAADEALPEDAPVSAAWDTYQRCRRYIESEWLGITSLEQVAETCRVSEAHLCRLFQRFGAVSPYQLLVGLKMAHAAALLLDRKLLVKEVGRRVGYGDPYHFSKAFKRVHGLSPDAFRSRGRG